ncbi:MAG: GIY-YIG nuclease family protein [Bacteroidia bacterium]
MFQDINKQGFVYITSNKNRTTFYIGVTSNIEQRVYEHKTGVFGGFTNKYNCHELVYYEEIQGMANAINREKQLKNWKREWKIELIKKENPEMKDLSAGWFNEHDY